MRTAVGLALAGGLTPSAWRQAARMSLGAALTLFVVELFHLPQGYWAVFTVVIVMQASAGGTLAAALDRLKGTLLGAAVGGLAAAGRPEGQVGLAAAIALAVAATSVLAASRPALKAAPVTAVIMLVSPAASAGGPLAEAAYRVIEIGIGSVVGVLVASVVLPARSWTMASAKGAEALQLMAGLLDLWAQRLDPSAAEGEGAHQRLRAALGGVEAAIEDVERERALRLTGGGLGRAFPRTLWRVRNDCVSLSRALGPLPEGPAARLEAAVRRLIGEEAGFMRRCAEALHARTSVTRGAVEAALADLESRLAALRAERATAALDLDAVGRLYGLVFALESLRRNLTDLADRIDEAAGDTSA